MNTGERLELAKSNNRNKIDELIKEYQEEGEAGKAAAALLTLISQRSEALPKIYGRIGAVAGTVLAGSLVSPSYFEWMKQVTIQVGSGIPNDVMAGIMSLIGTHFIMGVSGFLGFASGETVGRIAGGGLIDRAIKAVKES